MMTYELEPIMKERLADLFHRGLLKTEADPVWEIFCRDMPLAHGVEGPYLLPCGLKTSIIWDQPGMALSKTANTRIILRRIDDGATRL